MQNNTIRRVFYSPRTIFSFFQNHRSFFISPACLVLIFVLLPNPGMNSRLSAQGGTNPQKIQKEELPKWKSLSKKQIAKRLKRYAYAKVRMSMTKPIEYKKGKEVFYTPCPVIFPKIPGDLPCNFFEWEDMISSSENPTNEYREGGVVNVYLGEGKSHLLGGNSLVLGSRHDKKNPKKVHPDDLQVFYSPNKRISHYRMGNQVVLFGWKMEKGSPTLKTIFVGNMNKSLWIESAKEIDFSK